MQEKQALTFCDGTPAAFLIFQSCFYNSLEKKAPFFVQLPSHNVEVLELMSFKVHHVSI